MNERASRVWLSPRAGRLHAMFLVVVTGCVAACIWQIDRALGGNTLSWAYVFEWPIFAGYAGYMWWRLLHEGAQDTPPPRPAAGPSGGPSEAATAPRALSDAEMSGARGGVAFGSRDARDDLDDSALAAYNEYLAQLAERDRAHGR